MSVPSPGNPIPGMSSPTTTAAPKGTDKRLSDTPTETNPPSLQTLSAKRHDALLQILQEADALPPEALMQSDLPEQADRLLAEINAGRNTPAATKLSRRFQWFDKADAVNRLLAKLENAERRGDIPTPYPIDKDPLGLEAWAAQHNSEDLAAVAKECPQLRGALCVYLDNSGINHLARTFHAGKNIDFELDLRSRKTWRLFPAYDAVHHGPPANFIVLMKCALFLSKPEESVPQVERSLEEFIDIRPENEVASLIQYCKAWSWPDTVAMVPESKAFYAELTQHNPVEHMLFDLIAPIVATHPTKSGLLSMMADVNPSRLAWAMKPLNFKPTDAMIANAQTPEGREVLRQMNNRH